MDEVQLAVIGLLFAVVVGLIEDRYRQQVTRIALTVVTVALGGIALSFLHVNVLGDALDFFALDAGVVLGVSMAELRHSATPG
jgi:hypothetical protein